MGVYLGTEQQNFLFSDIQAESSFTTGEDAGNHPKYWDLTLHSFLAASHTLSSKIYVKSTFRHTDYQSQMFRSYIKSSWKNCTL